MDNDAGSGVELVPDDVEECGDGVGLGEVYLEREKAVGGLGGSAAAPAPRCNSHIVSIAGESPGDRGADPWGRSREQGQQSWLPFLFGMLTVKMDIERYGL